MKINPNDIARIQYEDRVKQPLLFEGLTFDRIYPTDIDAIPEYHNWFFIIMEVKREGVPLNTGQTTALQRLTDTIYESGKSAVLFICRHDVDTSSPIFLKDTMISEIYYEGMWHDVTPRTADVAWHAAMNWAKNKEEMHTK